MWALLKEINAQAKPLFGANIGWRKTQESCNCRLSAKEKNVDRGGINLRNELLISRILILMVKIGSQAGWLSGPKKWRKRGDLIFPHLVHRCFLHNRNLFLMCGRQLLHVWLPWRLSDPSLHAHMGFQPRSSWRKKCREFREITEQLLHRGGNRNFWQKNCAGIVIVYRLSCPVLVSFPFWLHTNTKPRVWTVWWNQWMKLLALSV